MDDQDTDVIAMNEDDPQGRRRRVRPGVAAGVALVAVAAGAGIGYAATHHGSPATSTAASALSAGTSASPSPSASALPGNPGMHGWRAGIGPGGNFVFGLGIGAGGVVHGQVVVPKSGGGYQTLDVQRGTVTAVSSSSLTVKSSDGYSATYTVSSSTIVDAKSAGIGSVKTGDSVVVTATVSGSTATAANVTDLSAIKAGRAAFAIPGAPAKPSAPPS